MTTPSHIVPLQMVDLKAQYQRLKDEIDQAVLECVGSTQYIGGPEVKSFQSELAEYLGAQHVIPCANGTDALQIALMGLGLQPGDEVIVPAFTYVATAEVIALLNLQPVMVDVEPGTFNTTAEIVEKAISPKTKAMVPVHLFGQSTDMEPLLQLAEKHGIAVIEDNAQSIGAAYTFADGQSKMAGTMGHVGTTSFFPSKNLGCYGDGGAIFCNDDNLAARLHMVANHGQSKRYYHEVVGVNSRLDALQAAILRIKLRYLDGFNEARQAAAAFYDDAFAMMGVLQTPVRQANSTHVFHQYTLQVKNGKRDKLAAYLETNAIPFGIYYPVPLYRQNAFKKYWDGQALPTTEALCQSVISLPMHSELDDNTLTYISEKVSRFFR